MEKTKYEKSKEMLRHSPVYIGIAFTMIGTFLIIMSIIFYFLSKQSYTFARDLQSKLFVYSGVGLLFLGILIVVSFRRIKHN